MCARGLYLDFLKFERLAGTPAHGSLAFNDLPCSLRHDTSDLIDRVGLSTASGSQSPIALPPGITQSRAVSRPYLQSPNVLPKRLLQARKSLSHIHTITIHTPKSICLKLPTNVTRTGHRNAPRMLRLQQADDGLPRHRQRGRLSLHVRGAPLRRRIRHRARRSGRQEGGGGGEQRGDRARQGGVGSEGGAEKGQGQGRPGQRGGKEQWKGCGRCE